MQTVDEATCRTCHATGPHCTPLVRDGTGDRMDLCPACLRSATRMQADGRDEHGRRRLADLADQSGLHVWRAPHVAYVLATEDVVWSADDRLVQAAPQDRMARVTVPHA